jgi:hypothetical protein
VAGSRRRDRAADSRRVFPLGRILEALFKIPFRAKGAVLRRAAAEIHSLTGAAKPQDSDDEEDANRRYYLLEVTIKPVGRTGSGFQLWEPGELQLVSLDAKAEDTDGDGDLCEIKRIEIESEGGFVPDEGMKYGGPQRLRLTLSAAPEARQFQFRYYFELFGNVSLPVQERQTRRTRTVHRVEDLAQQDRQARDQGDHRQDEQDRNELGEIQLHEGVDESQRDQGRHQQGRKHGHREEKGERERGE